MDIYQKMDFELSDDMLSYHWIIIGTDMNQSVIASYLAKHLQKKVLVLDLQQTYCSYIKTLSCKELRRFEENQLFTSNQKLNPFKIFKLKSYEQLNQKFWEKQKKIKGFNIQIRPKLLYGESPAVELLKDCNMDQYMDFASFKHINHFHQNKIIKIPLSKGQLYESQLPLKAKKQIFTLFHVLVKLYDIEFKPQKNYNSTYEFDKDVTIQQKYVDAFQKYKSQRCCRWVQEVGMTQYQRLIYDVVCLFAYDPKKDIPKNVDQQYTTLEMVKRANKFIKSCGIYSKTPYLLIDYGFSDISQAFSRRSSVFGSIYILHPKLTIQSITKNQEQFKVKTNLSDKQITCQRILSTPLFDRGQFQVSEKSYHVILLTDYLEGQSPVIWHISPSQLNVNQVIVLEMGSSCSCCPKQLSLFYIIHKQKEGKVQAIIEKFLEIRKIEKEKVQYVLSYEISYIRRKEGDVQFVFEKDGMEVDQNVKVLRNFFKENEWQFVFKEKKKKDQSEKQQLKNLLQKIQQLSIKK